VWLSVADEPLRTTGVGSIYSITAAELCVACVSCQFAFYGIRFAFSSVPRSERFMVSDPRRRLARLYDHAHAISMPRSGICKCNAATCVHFAQWAMSVLLMLYGPVCVLSLVLTLTPTSLETGLNSNPDPNPDPNLNLKSSLFRAQRAEPSLGASCTIPS